MKLTTLAVFGAGYLLGTRAGRERYEQLCELAHVAGGRFGESGARRRLEEYGARLEAYAAQSRVGQSRARARRVEASPAARGGKRWPVPAVTLGRSAGRPERAPRSFRLHQPRPWGDPARGDMVIGAFVLARLLGLRLLTLEAEVVVHDDDRAAAGAAMVMTQVRPDPPGLSPARPGRCACALEPVPPRGPGSRAGSGPLARAVQLVEQSADTLERTRRGQYRG